MARRRLPAGGSRVAAAFEVVVVSDSVAVEVLVEVVW